MFTGLIEEIGDIGSIRSISGGKRIEILCRHILDDLHVSDSVAVDGVCLTVTGHSSRGFFAEAVGETLKKSTLESLRPGRKVNLERAVKPDDRLGGHLVQGHVNGLGIISRLTRLGENYLLEVTVGAEVSHYVVDEGSIAINGISLTVARITGTRLQISVIPHTWKHTTLQYQTAGDRVNIETDVIAKYIEKLPAAKKTSAGSRISEEWLKHLGY